MRMAVWSPAGGIDEKKMARDIRRRIEAQTEWLGDHLEYVAGGFRLIQIEPETVVVLNMETKQIEALHAFVGQKRDWQTFPSDEMEDVLFALPNKLRAWAEEARAEENVKKLPAERRRALLQEAEAENVDEHGS